MTVKISPDEWLAQHTAELGCDADDCPAVFGTTRVYSSAAAIRKAARYDGWQHRKGSDFCPDHPAP